MPDLTLSEIESHLDRLPASLPPLRIAVLRNITVEPIEPYLRYQASRRGYRATVEFGAYDQLLQEALGPSLILSPQTDVVLLFTKLEHLSWPLARRYASLSPAAVTAEIQRLADWFFTVATKIREKTGALLLWHGVELLPYTSSGILDSQSDLGQNAALERVNQSLRAALHAIGNAHFVDLTQSLLRVGTKSFYDLRYWHLGKAPYAREALAEIASEDMKFLAAARGKQKKCLVLDCDNVLWGGVVGEEGPSGIALGKTFPGSAYSEFQEEILNLSDRGILIALCSKNNAEDVWEVIRKHPEMKLRASHIVAAEINWDDKATNLRRLARTLNIGLDSMVFIDDSPFEADLIRQALPEVEMLLVPEKSPVVFRQMLLACGLFDSLAVSDEDRRRGSMYKAEVERTALAETLTDLPSYYRSLEMVLHIAPATDMTLPRAAQLTQKTNQWNLTTRRYSEDDLKGVLKTGKTDLLTVHLADRFGDSGWVGVALLRYEGARAQIDTLLLSCRVLGRGVEDAFVEAILERAAARGALAISGEYRPTKKNGQVKDFYEKRGFDKAHEDAEAATYTRSLVGFAPRYPDFFKAIETPPIVRSQEH